MDARRTPPIIMAAVSLCLLAANYRTPNFIVDAPTAALAQEIGTAAERLRDELALEWTGTKMPRWGAPCMLTAKVGPNVPAGGATSFVFQRGEVFGWEMQIQGNRERILDSVLPHEITHTVFACHFRQALPRWADEGACTTVEHPEERKKQQQLLIRFLKTNRGISFSRMFRMKDYPKDVLPLYAQGYSLARYLLEQGGKRKFLQFLQDGLSDENWPRALRRHYGVQDMMHLQTEWLAWVSHGSPPLEDRSPFVLASGNAQSSKLIYRAQSSDVSPPPQKPRRSRDQLVEVPHQVAGSPSDTSRDLQSPPRTAAADSPPADNHAGQSPEPRVIFEWSRAQSLPPIRESRLPDRSQLRR